MTRSAVGLMLFYGCTDHPLEGNDCGPTSAQAIEMDATSSTGTSAANLTSDMGSISLTVDWTEGPFVGSDIINLDTTWTEARDLDDVEGCETRSGLYVLGSTSLSTASESLEARGTLRLWFPASEPESFEFVADEGALPVEANTDLEEAADAAYGEAGQQLWMSAWMSGRDSIGVDASYGGDDVVTTGHVQLGTLSID